MICSTAHKKSFPFLFLFVSTSTCLFTVFTLRWLLLFVVSFALSTGVRMLALLVVAVHVLHAGWVLPVQFFLGGVLFNGGGVRIDRYGRGTACVPTYRTCLPAVLVFLFPWLKEMHCRRERAVPLGWTLPCIFHAALLPNSNRCRATAQEILPECTSIPTFPSFPPASSTFCLFLWNAP